MDISKIDSIAIGGFDGMHIGHQELFSHLGDNGAIVAIETGYANLTPRKDRERYSKYPIFYYELSQIKHLDGKEFVDALKNRFVSLKKIVVGYDFHFGKDRKYSFDDLRSFFDGEVIVVDEVCLRGDSVHSHKIRAKISLGDIAGANRFLGHNYTISGSVIAGQGLGKKQFVPTINIITSGYLLPIEGVYAAFVRLDDSEHLDMAVVFLGHRVSTDGSFAIEAHIIDRDIKKCERLSISFVDFIRANRKFDSFNELKSAILFDIDSTKDRLKHLSL